MAQTQWIRKKETQRLHSEIQLLARDETTRRQKHIRVAHVQTVPGQAARVGKDLVRHSICCFCILIHLPYRYFIQLLESLAHKHRLCGANWVAGLRASSAEAGTTRRSVDFSLISAKCMWFTTCGVCLFTVQNLTEFHWQLAL